MNDYPVSLDVFKTYFSREAGLEYQAYPTFIKTTYGLGDKVRHNDLDWVSTAEDNWSEPGTPESSWEGILEEEEELPEWVEPIKYAEGDKVVAMVNFKPGVWESVADDNYDIPGKTDNWEFSEEGTEEMESWILDADILRAMGEASFKFSKSIFPKDRQEIIFLYLTMFFLVYDRQAAASGINGNSAAGPVIHRTVGKMSVTYMQSTLYKSNPSYEFLSSNEYGKKAYNLMAPYLRGGVRTFVGANTGD